MKQLITNLDIWGCTTSFMCAIHCAILPVLFSVGMIGSHSILAHPVFEVIVIAITISLVFKAIIRPYLRFKQNKWPFVIANLGLVLVAIHHMFEAYGTQLVVMGGFSIAFAHIINFSISNNSLSKSVD